MEKILQLIDESRKGLVESQKELLNKFLEDTQGVISLMGDEDKNWLMQLIQEGNVKALYCLNYGASHKFEPWVDTLIDEDTGEEVPWIRYNLIDGSTITLSDEEKELFFKKEMLCDYVRSIEAIDDYDVWALRYFNFHFNFLKELYDKHQNSSLAVYLAEKLYFGDEEQGVLIDKEKAKYYFDLAGKTSSLEILKDLLNTNN